MVWPFSSSSSSSDSASQATTPLQQSTSMTDMTDAAMPGIDFSSTGGAASTMGTDTASKIGFDKYPVFALDQLKHAGVPFEKQLSPYLQMDPSVFRESTPQ
ncbi:unnamed protein product [Gongylonema pulchrum]|uniref:Jun domain-containing protein n=1 Tax=Gongylonema pulchrum TaxID=637853 RepID=A0A183DBQ4_9BILA|nr:unnamed protein product [Gongylonema pulchrum]